MAVSSQSKAVLDLGKKLVDELGLDTSVDTLGRWMAHYIVELIHDAENAAPQDKPSSQERCAAAILDLWQHRSALPNGTRPFEDAEPILRALESLDPCDETPRYFRPPRMMARDAEQDTEVGRWLKVADGIDSTAKELIRHCFAQAVQAEQDKTKEWVALAEDAGLDTDTEVSALRILLREAATREEKPEDVERKRIEKRIERLEAFRELAAELAADLRKKLHADREGESALKPRPNEHRSQFMCPLCDTESPPLRDDRRNYLILCDVCSTRQSHA